MCRASAPRRGAIAVVRIRWCWLRAPGWAPSGAIAVVRIRGCWGRRARRAAAVHPRQGPGSIAAGPFAGSTPVTLLKQLLAELHHRLLLDAADVAPRDAQH